MAMSNYSVGIEDKFDKLMNKKENSQVVIKRLGAEVISYRVWDKENKRTLPLLWNDNNDSPPPEGGWKNHATVLFPHVGGLKNNESWLGDIKITSRGNLWRRRIVIVIPLLNQSITAMITVHISTTASRQTMRQEDITLSISGWISFTR